MTPLVRWPGEPGQCTCTRIVVDTLEETMACRPGRPCADHLQDLADADDYEAAYALMAAAASGVN